MSKMGNSPAVLGVDEGISYLGLPYSKESASKNNKMNNWSSILSISYHRIPYFCSLKNECARVRKLPSFSIYTTYWKHQPRIQRSQWSIVVTSCTRWSGIVIWHRNDSVRAIEVVYVSYVLNTKEVGNVGTKMLWNIYGGDEGTMNTLPE